MIFSCLYIQYVCKKMSDVEMIHYLRIGFNLDNFDFI